MLSRVVYHCRECGSHYRLHEASRRKFFCCGAYLERREDASAIPAPVPTGRPSETASPGPASPGLEVIEVIPWRATTPDALAVESLFSRFKTEPLFSLELAGDAKSRRLLLRGSRRALDTVRHQLQSTYDQIAFRRLSPGEDPARPTTFPVATAQLKLRRPVYLPLRTYADGTFAEADPVRGLLGALDGFEGEERALTQIILRPAFPGWSDRYRGSARQVQQAFSGEHVTFAVALRQFLSVMAIMTAVALGLWALLSFVQQAWPSFVLAALLFSAVMGAVTWLFQWMLEQTDVDPELVRIKIAKPAFDVSLRVFVVGHTRARAEQKLSELIAAYGCANLESGNALVRERAEFDPRVLELERAPWWKEWTGQVMRLNVSELAGLWHPPLGPAIPLMKHMLSRRILPLPEQVRTGVLVGYSNYQDKRIPVRLAPEILSRNVFMVAKTQKGKSTLMAHLAAAAMQTNSALVVIDPHGDLVRSLLPLVPRERVGDVIYIDFGDRQQVVGLNLLDMNQGRTADAIAKNILHVMELIWRDYWGPRMESALRTALLTLLAANTKLAPRGEPQFTLIDIPSLFELPAFRHRLIEEYVSDDEIRKWWEHYYERELHDYMRLEVINPVLTKIHRFSTDTVVRNIVGQPSSTVNFGKLLDERRILLVNTAAGVIGFDAGGLLGAVLIDHINFAVRAQLGIPDPRERAHVVFIIDEFQTIPGVEYPSLLGELQKMGASFVLATQSLGPLKTLYPNLKESIFSNIAGLFVFQTSAEDADLLRHELDEEVEIPDITNLDDFSCYLKTQLNGVRLAIMSLDILKPNAGQRSIVEQVLALVSRHTVPGPVVESTRQAIHNRWYSREQTLRRKLSGLQSIDAESRSHSSKQKPEGPRQHGKSNDHAPAEPSANSPRGATPQTPAEAESDDHAVDRQTGTNGKSEPSEAGNFERDPLKKRKPPEPPRTERSEDHQESTRASDAKRFNP